MHTNQIEADGCLILHAKNASHEYDQIVFSADTDVTVLATAYCSVIPAQLSQITSTRETIVVSKVVDTIGSDVCDALLGIQKDSFKGCDSDSESAFIGNGEKNVFHLIKSKSEHCNTMKSQEVNFTVSCDLYEKCEKFVCALYGR